MLHVDKYSRRMERNAEWRKICMPFVTFLTSGNREERLRELDHGPTYSVCI